ncbi:SatD family protein [Nocardioides sp. Kera G14]|uniref:SatD family protein n=1 Tax=Nocardioides sp. Kera G14 TaxID=2884264 RepID=UPI001D12C37E|nr:SatD family protein [Nocardioides sp. Kera G14]UDY24931.1 SatD family protein [Nocardioides sp. Kera G14]
MAEVVTLIGDVVDSGGAPDRRALHRALSAAIAGVNEAFRPLTPLRVTVGDEFQGAFAALGPALQATLRLRLAMAPYDVRFGLGRGTVTVLSEEPRVEDGPGWWAARAAIEEVATLQRRAATRSVRTLFDDPAVNAALLLRDELLAQLGDHDMSVLSDMISGMSQEQIAARLGVSPSAVSQRVRRASLGVLLRSDELLGGLA